MQLKPFVAHISMPAWVFSLTVKMAAINAFVHIKQSSENTKQHSHQAVIKVKSKSKSKQLYSPQRAISIFNSYENTKQHGHQADLWKMLTAEKSAFWSVQCLNDIMEIKWRLWLNWPHWKSGLTHFLPIKLFTAYSYIHSQSQNNRKIHINFPKHMCKTCGRKLPLT
jgi:hypothetical protein